MKIMKVTSPPVVVNVLEDGIQDPMGFRLSVELPKIGKVFVVHFFILAACKIDVTPLSICPFINATLRLPEDEVTHEPNNKLEHA